MNVSTVKTQSELQAMSKSREELVTKYGRGVVSEKTAEKAKALDAAVEKATDGEKPTGRTFHDQAREMGQALRNQGMGKEVSMGGSDLGRLPVQGTPAIPDRGIAATPGKSLMADYAASVGGQDAGRQADVVAKYGRTADMSKEKEAEKAKEPEKEPGA